MAEYTMNRTSHHPTNVYITTLGCKVNQVESESIRSELREQGYTNDKTGNPDVCIINTCAVTQKAAMQSRQAIRRAIREHPEAVVIATGCYAQSDPDELKKIKGIHAIVGNSHKNDLSRLLLSGNSKTGSHPVISHEDIRNERNIKKMSVPEIGNRTRTFIKVQDGCEHFCTYCIVPYTRGPSRSLPVDDVMNQLSVISKHNSNEVVLTGIHLGRYGADLQPPSTLLDLISRICDSKMIHRIRLSSIEPNELTDDLLNYIAASDSVCRHFHIPLQSGDPGILKRMNRPYGPELFMTLVEQIHRLLPDAAIGVDVMAGFPGETDDAFNNTYDLIASLPISYLHVFPFSPRPGTPASTFKDPIDPRIIKTRRNQLMLLGKQKKNAFYSKMIGSLLEVLIENKKDTDTGYLTGISSNYVRVLVDSDDRLQNKLVLCRIKKIVTQNSVLGSPV